MSFDVQIHFDEDRIICERFGKHKDKKNFKCKNPSRYNMLKNKISLIVDKYFNFDPNYHNPLIISKFTKIREGIIQKFYLESDNQITNDLIRNYFIPRPSFCKTERDFTNFCMYIYNLTHNYSISFQLPEENHIGECPICFENKENMKQLQCNHLFCSDCLNETFDKKLLHYCPLCRASVNQISIKFNINNFMKPIPIEDFHVLINLVTNFSYYHNKIKMSNLSIVYYFSKILEIDVSHFPQIINESDFFKVFDSASENDISDSPKMDTEL